MIRRGRRNNKKYRGHVARTDCPEALPQPADSGAAPPSLQSPAAPITEVTVARPDDTVNGGNLPAIVHAAMQQDLALAPDQRQAIANRVASIKTRADAQRYLAEVQEKIRPLRRESARQ